MANIVGNLIDDVTWRLNDTKYQNYPLASILIIMNQKYQEINEELRCLEKKLTLSAGTFSDTVNTYDIPDDWIEPFILNGTDDNNKYTTPLYIPKEMWNDESYSGSTVFTILGDKLIFGNVDADTAYEIYYYSSGLELVNKDDNDLGDDETNTPEWKSRYHRLLVYLTCLEIAADYPFLERDIVSAEKLKTELRKQNKNRQRITPMIIGGIGIQMRKKDPDYIDGMPVTRF